MMQSEVLVIPWPAGMDLNEQAVRRVLRSENLVPYRWSNGPHDTYSAHVHPYNKVIYVVSGSITFGLPQLGRTIRLDKGDRLDLPQGSVHEAVVGPRGVVCLEAHC